MNDVRRLLWLVVGIVAGGAGVAFFLSQAQSMQAGNDRYEDFVICTGPVAINAKAQTDGVWLLDYKAGKLLGTVIDRTLGKILSWAEVDLLTEFGLQPKQNVHFLMTTGAVTRGQAAL